MADNQMNIAVGVVDRVAPGISSVINHIQKSLPGAVSIAAEVTGGKETDAFLKKLGQSLTEAAGDAQKTAKALREVDNALSAKNAKKYGNSYMTDLWNDTQKAIHKLKEYEVEMDRLARNSKGLRLKNTNEFGDLKFVIDQARKGIATGDRDTIDRVLADQSTNFYSRMMAELRAKAGSRDIPNSLKSLVTDYEKKLTEAVSKAGTSATKKIDNVLRLNGKDKEFIDLAHRINEAASKIGMKSPIAETEQWISYLVRAKAVLDSIKARQAEAVATFGKSGAKDITSMWNTYKNQLFNAVRGDSPQYLRDFLLSGQLGATKIATNNVAEQLKGNDVFKKREQEVEKLTTTVTRLIEKAKQTEHIKGIDLSKTIAQYERVLRLADLAKNAMAISGSEGAFRANAYMIKANAWLGAANHNLGMSTRQQVFDNNEADKAAAARAKAAEQEAANVEKAKEAWTQLTNTIRALNKEENKLNKINSAGEFAQQIERIRALREMAFGLRNGGVLGDMKSGNRSIQQELSDIKRYRESVGEIFGNKKEAQAQNEYNKALKEALDLMARLGRMRNKEGFGDNQNIIKAINLLNEYIQALRTAQRGGGMAYVRTLNPENGKPFTGTTGVEVGSLRDVLNMRNQMINSTKALMRTERERGVMVDGQMKQYLSGLAQVNDRMRNFQSLTSQVGMELGALYSISRIRQFLSSLIEVGGQFAYQRAAITNILGDYSKAETLFNRVKELALHSPFSTLQLDNYVKQLSAFDVQYSDLYEKLRKIADVAAGTGADMSRIILAYGHVMSAGNLTGIQLRQFSNANINMVGTLAKMYSEREGRIVTKREVYKRTSNKEVSAEDVDRALMSMAEEGGKFYHMQEAMADTTKAVWKNLGDAVNHMYMDIEKSESGILKGVGKLLTGLVKAVNNFTPEIMFMATAFGVLRTSMAFSNKSLGNNMAKYIDLSRKAAKIEAGRIDRTAKTTGVGSLTKEQRAYYNGASSSKQMAANIFAGQWQANGKNWAQAVDAFSKGHMSYRELSAIGKQLGIAENKIAAIGNKWSDAGRKFRGFYEGAMSGLRALGSAIKGIGIQLGVSFAVGLAMDAIYRLMTASSRAREKQEELTKSLRANAAAIREVVEEFANVKGVDISPSERDQVIKELRQGVKDNMFGASAILGDAQTKNPTEEFERLRDVLTAAAEAQNFWAENANNIGDVVNDKTIDKLKDLNDSYSRFMSTLSRAASSSSWKALVKHLSSVNKRFAEITKGKSDLEALQIALDNKEFADSVKKFYETTMDGFGQNARAVQNIKIGDTTYKDNGVFTTLFDSLNNNSVQKEVKEFFDSIQGEMDNRSKELLTRYKSGSNEYVAGILSVLKKLVDDSGVDMSESLQREILKLTNERYKLGIDVELNTFDPNRLQEWQQDIQKKFKDTGSYIEVQLKASQSPIDFAQNLTNAIKSINDQLKKNPIVIQVASNMKAGDNWESLYNQLKPYYEGGFGGMGAKPRTGPVTINGKTFAGTAEDWMNIDSLWNAVKLMMVAYEDKTNKLGYVDLSEINKKKSRNSERKDLRDSELEKLKDEFSMVKKLKSAYDELRKTHSKANALEMLKSDERYKDMSKVLKEYFANGDITPEKISAAYQKIFEKISAGDYKALSMPKDLKGKELEAAYTERKKFGQDLKEAQVKNDNDTLAESINTAIESMDKFIEREKKALEIYQQVFSASGNKDLAALLSGTATPDFNRQQSVLNAYKEALKAQLDKNGMFKNGEKYSIDELATMKQEDIANLPKELQPLAKNLQKDLKQLYDENTQEIANFVKSLSSISAQLKRIDAEYELDYLKLTSNPEFYNLSDEMKVDLLNELERKRDTAKTELGSDYAQAIKFGRGLSANMLHELTLEARKQYERNFEETKDPQWLEKINQLDEKEREAEKVSRTQLFKNLTDSFADAKDRYNRAMLGDDEEEKRKAKKHLDSLQNVINGLNSMSGVLAVVNGSLDGLKKVMDLFSDFFGSLGKGQLANTFSNISDGIGVVTAALAPVNNIISSAMSGDVSGILSNAIAAPFEMVLAPWTLGNKLHDKYYQQEIDALDNKNKHLEYLNENLQREINNTFGVNLNKQQEYLKNLKEQKDNLEAQQNAYMQFKDKDQATIDEYDKKVKEATDQIQQYWHNFWAEMGIDLKDWSKQLADALTEAWSNGMDAAQAWHDKVGDLMRGVVKNWISKNYIEKALAPLERDLFGEGGRLTNGRGLTSDTLDYIEQTLDNLYNGLSTLQPLWNDIDEKYPQNRLQGSITASEQSMTEGTANLLASYVNAIREQVGQNSIIAQSQLTQLNAIAQSNQAIADNTAAMRAVLEASANGSAPLNVR